MSIPDPTIDPVTGLPLLNPSDVVQQIPLGVQAFPWKDMGATALPTRGPLYGDDILPVSAFVAGQHPSTGSAQTVTTDGNHALDVFVVNQAGSGGASQVKFPPLTNAKTQDLGATSSTGDANCILTIGTVKFILYAISFAVWVHDTTGSAVTPVAISFDVFQANKRIYSLGTFYATPTTWAGTKAVPFYSYTRKWDGGLDLSWFSFVGGAEFDLAFRGQDTNLIYTISGNFTYTDDST